MLAEDQDRRAAGPVAKIGLKNALIIDGDGGRRRISRWPRATSRNRCAAGPGHQRYDILRREKLVLTKAAVKRWRSGSNEAGETATPRPTTSSSPGNGKIDHRVRKQPGGVQLSNVRANRKSRRPWSAVRREGNSVNTLSAKEEARGFKGTRRRRSDVKKAVVTLAEGQKIDITTGL